MRWARIDARKDKLLVYYDHGVKGETIDYKRPKGSYLTACARKQCMELRHKISRRISIASKVDGPLWPTGGKETAPIQYPVSSCMQCARANVPVPP